MSGTVHRMSISHPIPAQALERLLTHCERRGLERDAVAVAAAVAFAAEAHDGQFRKSGEPYITHPIEVARLVADLEGTLEMVIAAVLHDTIEDTPVEVGQLRRRFGDEVTGLVMGCTKTARVRAQGDEQAVQAERLRTLFVALASDPRVVVIKLADRLHNLRTIDALPEHKARRIARETLTIHSPLAHRLGLRSLMAELEDRAFAVADPVGFQQVEVALADLEDLHVRLASARDQLSTHLHELGIDGEVSGRIKHRWSLYRKAVRYGLAPDHLHDLLGLRIVVADEARCYELLEAVRLLWSLEEERTKDYIAHPKSNGYRSLHTVARTAVDTRVELQIRTVDMHRAAEFGPAAHWAYKIDGSTEAPWLRRLLDWHHESASVSEYLEGVQRELEDRRDVLILTPAGDVHNLPEGASVIDFAYAVHTDIGDRAVGAIVDGDLVGLDAVVLNGQTVEILTGRRPGPSLHWLNHSVTSKARHAIRRHHQRARRVQLRQHGSTIVEQAWRDCAVPHPGMIPDALLAALAVRSAEDLFEQVATGRITAGQLRRAIGALHPSRQPATVASQHSELDRPVSSQMDLEAVAVGLHQVQVRLARCCTPAAGCVLQGVVRGGQVSVHRQGCPSAVTALDRHPGRRVDCHWVRRGWRLEALTLTVADRPGLLADIAAQVQSAGGELRRAELSTLGAVLVVAVHATRSTALRAALRLCAGVSSVRLH